MAVSLTVGATTRQAVSELSKLDKVLTVGLGVTIGNLATQLIPALGRAVDQTIDRMQELGPVSSGFDSLTRSIGSTAEEMLGNLRPATRGLIDDFTLMKMANNAVILGVATSAEGYANLAENAVRLGRAVGLEATQAIESMTTGIGRQSRMMLDNLGVIVSAEDAYRTYADRIGTTADKLDDYEKKLAFAEAATKSIEVAVSKLGPETRNLGDLIQSLNVRITNYIDGALRAAERSSAWQEFLEGISQGSHEAANEIGFMERAAQGMWTTAGVLGTQLSSWQGILDTLVSKGANIGSLVETRIELDLLREKSEELAPKVTRLKETFQQFNERAAKEAAERAEQFRKEMEEMDKKMPKWTPHLVDLGDAVEDVADAFEPLKESVPFVHNATNRWLFDIRNPLSEIGQLWGDWANQMDTIVISLGGKDGGKSFLGGIADGFKSIWQAFKDANKPTSIITGLLESLGAGLLSLASKILGKIGQAIIGFFAKLFGKKDTLEKRIKSVGAGLAWLTGISDDMIKKVAELALEVGDNLTAQLMLLGDILQQAGINSFHEFERAANLAAEAVRRGILDQIEPAIQVLIDNLSLMDEKGRQAFRGLVEAARAAGVTIQALDAHFVSTAQTISDNVGPMLDSLEQRWLNNSAALDDLGTVVSFTGQRFEDDLRFVIDALAVTFTELVAQGIPVQDILRIIGDDIARATALAEDAGIKIPDAFIQIGNVIEALSVNRVQGLIDGLMNMQQIIQSIAGFGLLPTETMIASFAKQVQRALRSLISEGLSGDEIIFALGPSLGTLVELAQSGFKLPNVLRKLLGKAGIDINAIAANNPQNETNDHLARQSDLQAKMTSHLLGIRQEIAGLRLEIAMAMG